MCTKCFQKQTKKPLNNSIFYFYRRQMVQPEVFRGKYEINHFHLYSTESSFFMGLGTNMLKCVLQCYYNVHDLLRIYVIQFVKYLFGFYENFIIYFFTIVSPPRGIRIRGSPIRCGAVIDNARVTMGLFYIHI